MNYYCCGCAITVTAVAVASPAALAQSVYRIPTAIRNVSFLKNVKTDPVKNISPLPPFQRVPGSLSWKVKRWGVKLVTHLNLLLRLRTSGNTPPITQHAFTTGTGPTLILCSVFFWDVKQRKLIVIRTFPDDPSVLSSRVRQSKNESRACKFDRSNHHIITNIV